MTILNYVFYTVETENMKDLAAYLTQFAQKKILLAVPVDESKIPDQELEKIKSGGGYIITDKENTDYYFLASGLPGGKGTPPYPNGLEDPGRLPEFAKNLK